MAQEGRGYGAACLTGARAATAEALVFLDGDYSDPPDAIPRLLAPSGKAAPASCSARGRRGGWRPAPCRCTRGPATGWRRRWCGCCTAYGSATCPPSRQSGAPTCWRSA
ncbi:MAG: glycosyltransferase [Dehalococcoidia bacterium]